MFYSNLINHRNNRVFDARKTSKILALIFLGALFLWFTLDMTGLRFGQVKIVTSAFVDGQADFAFWLLFVACIVLFVVNDGIGKYVVTSYVFVWALIQYAMYFGSPESIAQYNAFFFDTHHLFASSAYLLIKDTYHIVLDLLILLGIVSMVAYLLIVAFERRKAHRFLRASERFSR